MASLEANINMQFAKGPMEGGPHQFRVSGNMYHRMGPLTPRGNQTRGFAQVYILETGDQLKAWQGLPLSSQLREDLLRQLGAMLNTHNAYVQVLQNAAELEVPYVTSCCGAMPTLTHAPTMFPVSATLQRSFRMALMSPLLVALRSACMGAGSNVSPT